MTTHNNDSVIVSEPDPNWPELFSKTVDDLARIGRTEIELLETRLKHSYPEVLAHVACEQKRAASGPRTIFDDFVKGLWSWPRRP